MQEPGEKIKYSLQNCVTAYVNNYIFRLLHNTCNIFTIALFTATFSHLHYYVFGRGCEAILGKKCKIAQNCLTSTLKTLKCKRETVTVKRALI